MTVWSRLSFWFTLRHIMYVIGLGLLIVVIITTIILVRTTAAAPYTDKTITFSARLKSASGGVVPDGSYNVRFHIYAQATEGTPVWSETYDDTHRIQVMNGYMNVKLGLRQAFGTSVNWGDNLWLTMDVGGREQTPDWDGEMNPRVQLTATPYALNSGAVGGKTAENLVQLGQGKQTDSTNGSSIHIDKTGTGNLVQLQASGDDVLVIGGTGSITLGGNTDQTISMGEADEGVGHNLTIAAGTGTSGGDLVLQGGDATGVDGDGGNVQIDTGAPTGEGSGGSLSLGTVNAETITLGNAGSTTTVQGELHISTIDSAEAGELIIGGNNATSINLGQDTSVDGSVTMKNKTDNTAALQVQNSDGDSVLNVDTLNNTISLGTVDDIGTLLVLDTKTTAGDPVGTPGAMYYNANAGKFRCYEAGKEGNEWKDCITPLPVSVTAEDPTVTDLNTPVDIDNMTFELAAHTKYYYKFIIIHESEDTNVGTGFGVTAPDNLVMSNWCINTTAITSTANPGLGSYCGTGDAATTTTGAVMPGNHFTSIMEGYIQTGATVGDLKLRVKSETNGKEVTIDPASFGILQIVQ